jgi:Uncharacterised protein family UPF0547
MRHERDSERLLERSRKALQDGKRETSLRLAWRAAVAAVRDRDAEGLERVVGVATMLRDGATGRLEKDADGLLTYSRICLQDVRSGVRHLNPVARLLKFPGSESADRPASGSLKTCPDCAESVMSAARVCRYCGFRFDT